jgi:hypothetical protein
MASRSWHRRRQRREGQTPASTSWDFGTTFTQANDSPGNYVTFSITAGGHADGDTWHGLDRDDPVAHERVVGYFEFDGEAALGRLLGSP